MKLFIFADIHGSLYWLRKALEKFEQGGGDYLVLLGDELYHGARNPLPEEYNPKEVAALLNRYASRIIAVRGNCDSEVDEMVLDFPMMSASSSILADGRRLFLTHGHIYNENNMPKLQSGDVFFYGHTHIPKAEKKQHIYIVNPGSISLPKENSPHTYGILEGSRLEIRDIDGGIYKICNFD